MLWAYAKLRAGGAFGLFATGFHDGPGMYVRHIRCTKELW